MPDQAPLHSELLSTPQQHVTHNRCYATYNDFCRSVLNFLRKEIHFCDSGTDNFRVINPADFRILKA